MSECGCNATSGTPAWAEDDMGYELDTEFGQAGYFDYGAECVGGGCPMPAGDAGMGYFDFGQRGYFDYGYQDMFTTEFGGQSAPIIPDFGGKVISHNKVMAVKADAGHDTSGNPRRGWFVYQRDGRTVGFVDEGYRGRHALTSKFPNAVELTTLEVKPGEYRTAVKDALGGWAMTDASSEFGGTLKTKTSGKFAAPDGKRMKYGKAYVSNGSVVYFIGVKGKPSYPNQEKDAAADRAVNRAERDGYDIQHVERRYIEVPTPIGIVPYVYQGYRVVRVYMAAKFVGKPDAKGTPMIPAGMSEADRRRELAKRFQSKRRALKIGKLKPKIPAGGFTVPRMPKAEVPPSPAEETQAATEQATGTAAPAAPEPYFDENIGAYYDPASGYVYDDLYYGMWIPIAMWFEVLWMVQQEQAGAGIAPEYQAMQQLPGMDPSSGYWPTLEDEPAQVLPGQAPEAWEETYATAAYDPYGPGGEGYWPTVGAMGAAHAGMGYFPFGQAPQRGYFDYGAHLQAGENIDHGFSEDFGSDFGGLPSEIEASMEAEAAEFGAVGDVFASEGLARPAIADPFGG